jgi:hypothetical protein
MNRILMLGMVVLLSAAGCQGIDKEQQVRLRFGPYPQIDQSRLYGMGFPASLRVFKAQHFKEDFSYKEGFALMHAMGAKSWRSWMHTRLILKDPVTPIPERVAVYKEMNRLAQQYDLEIIGMNHDWFSGSADPVAMPPRDMTEGSAYRKVLDDYRTSWKTLASQFPEVTWWEVGNEWNHDPFLHPLDYSSSGMKSVFTWKQKAAIATDLMYYAAQGIRAGNANAKVICFAPAPVYDTASLQIFKGQGLPHENNVTCSGIAAFLMLVYENIKSGHWPSTNTNDYFDALSWHPYSWNRQPGQWWVEMNHLAYQVVCAYGDEGKPVFLTEWGVTEEGKPEKEVPNADNIEKAYRLIEAQMPYIKTMHYFRLYQDLGALHPQQEDWGGAGEAYYGLFTEPWNGHKPTEKAIRYQKLAGGKGDLRMFESK